MNELLYKTDVDTFKHLSEISHYNKNYYAFCGCLLFAKSDDDNTTEWFQIVNGMGTYLGYSLTSDDPELIINTK